MQESEFIDKFMKHILNGVNIPKVQVERAITPMLSLFIESILNKYFEHNIEYSGEYKLVSPEFPLKKEDNNQSSNVDYLLVNNSKKVLIFFELKTDIGSLDKNQMNSYIEYKKKISNFTCKILRDDLIKIQRSSNGLKYNYIVTSFDSAIENFDIHKMCIVYLAPYPIVNQIKKTVGIDFVLAFKDLPENLNHNFSKYWIVIRENLLILDNHFKKKDLVEIADDPIITIVANIKDYISQSKKKIKPISFQIGIIGEGKRPNYQVKFTDNSIITFFYNGKPHTIPIFKQENLSDEYFWKDWQ
jgi:hypothetical protein